MIHLDQTVEPSDHVRQRSRRMWVKTITPDSYIVKPKEKGKVRRAVKLLTGSHGIQIECTDLRTGEPCPANLHNRHCSHSEAAINRLLTNVKRAANKKLKEQQHMPDSQGQS